MTDHPEHGTIAGACITQAPDDISDAHLEAASSRWTAAFGPAAIERQPHHHVLVPADTDTPLERPKLRSLAIKAEPSRATFFRVLVGASGTRHTGAKEAAPMHDDPTQWWTDDDDRAVLKAYDDTQKSNWRAVVRTLHRILGPLTPEFLVEFARPPGSPLHECFTWGPGVVDQAQTARTMLEAWSPNVQR